MARRASGRPQSAVVQTGDRQPLQRRRPAGALLWRPGREVVHGLCAADARRLNPLRSASAARPRQLSSSLVRSAGLGAWCAGRSAGNRCSGRASVDAVRAGTLRCPGGYGGTLPNRSRHRSARLSRSRSISLTSSSTRRERALWGGKIINDLKGIAGSSGRATTPIAS